MALKLSVRLALQHHPLVDPGEARLGRVERHVRGEADDRGVRAEGRAGPVDVEEPVEVADVRRPEAGQARADDRRRPRRDRRVDAAGVGPLHQVGRRAHVQRAAGREQVVVAAVPDHRRDRERRCRGGSSTWSPDHHRACPGRGRSAAPDPARRRRAASIAPPAPLPPLPDVPPLRAAAAAGAGHGCRRRRRSPRRLPTPRRGAAATVGYPAVPEVVPQRRRCPSGCGTDPEQPAHCATRTNATPPTNPRHWNRAG